MKAVLISIRPKWCELIASGKKTVEVRKTRPKLETPFKCYIYCTKPKMIVRYVFRPEDYPEYMRPDKPVFCKIPDGSSLYCSEANGNGKVIGEFVCDMVRTEYEVADELVDVVFEKTSCISAKKLVEYSNGKPLYSWHISKLVIYDEPKELSEFQRAPSTDHCGWGECDLCKYGRYDEVDGWICKNVIPRSPQSWCYVEELNG